MIFNISKDIGLSYPLEKPYRVHRKIIRKSGGKNISFYGPYQGGMEDVELWEDVVKLWTSDTRIFAKLPIREKDVDKIIDGKKKYILDIRSG